MAEYVPITKELRDYLNSMTPYEAFSPWVDNDTVLAMLDNIDAIHRSLEAENERLHDASKQGDDWPLDADGVPICVIFFWIGENFIFVVILILNRSSTIKTFIPNLSFHFLF